MLYESPRQTSHSILPVISEPTPSEGDFSPFLTISFRFFSAMSWTKKRLPIQPTFSLLFPLSFLSDRSAWKLCVQLFLPDFDLARSNLGILPLVVSRSGSDTNTGFCHAARGGPLLLLRNFRSGSSKLTSPPSGYCQTASRSSSSAFLVLYLRTARWL